MSRASTRRRVGALIAAVGAALALLVVGILVARWLRSSPETAGFFVDFPGMTALPDSTPEGFPAWLSWTHFLNTFLLVFIVRSGLRIRSRERPPAFVTRRNSGWLRTARSPRRLSVHVWWHLVVDSLWVLIGVAYVVLLFASGHWLRLVPTSWDVLPNALSAGVQYLSLDWPVHDSWVHYNSLQQLLYAATVFVAGPVALVTGLRLSPLWRHEWRRASRLYSERAARLAHFWIMVYFIAFTIVHVGLVLTTGALRNLNAMYAGRRADDWIGAGIFAVSLVAIVIAWFVLTPSRQARIAELSSDVKRMPPHPRG